MSRVGGTGGRLIREWVYIYVYICMKKRVRLGGDSGGVVKLGLGLSFSWKRALGITALKRKISKVLGIPLTRSGRRAKLGRWLGMK